ncbi:hypothetical protein LZ575_07480 [Antarcticibacterium sp. 1MA-6-2]|uniref:ABC transporter permease/M1 family aminopeptidase n=1 Tax=Antarcticibacterium sp. 1MA-6-2 TaxID=2908210 RepID=UPI001F19EF9D|nr:ABC transporter permease [Antarcticibacterium sp. 1MA-6-2]UJH92359.1 hypothetical protein LZ575_07480 [Antarcticibacterium sp. 1MA-6-2]
MKFREILRFELNFQMHQIATWIYIVVVIVFTGLASWSMFDNVREGEYFLNSPVIVSLLAAVASMFGLFLTAAVAGSGAVRDLETRIDPIMYTTPIKKFTYLSARFIAAFLIQLLVIIFSLLLLHIASLIPAFNEFFTDSKAISFIDAFLLFALPNAFLTTAILFSLGILTRRSMAGYLGAALLFFICLMTMDIVAGELGLWELGKKLDPSGLTVLRELRLLQTPLEIKSGFVPVSSSLLINRLIWMGIGCCFLVLAYFRFSFVHQTSGRKKIKINTTNITEEQENRVWNAPVSTPTDKRIFDPGTQLRQAKFLLFKSFGSMIKGKVWLLIVLTAFILIAVSEEVLEGQLGVPKFPTAWRVLQLLSFFPAVNIVVAVIITFYAGELVWKERDARVNEMTDAAPVPDWALFLSKSGALVLMILFIQSIFLFSGIIIQVMQDYYNFDLWLYLKVLFGFQLIDLILFAIIALAVHVLVNQKYLGHLLVFLAYYYMEYSGTLGLNHNLLIYGSDPGWSYSEISKFDPYVIPWLWFKLFWAGWAILLALMINLFWNRGKESFFSKRVNKAKMNITGTTARVGIPTAVFIFILGGFIFYNTNIRNRYITADERIERKALYEKKYGRFDRIPQPLLSGIKLKGEIYPEQRKVEIWGEYLLINKTKVEIDTIHIATTSGTEIPEMKFSRSFQENLIDNDLGHRIYKLHLPLKPGDSVFLEFKAIFDQKGFSNQGIDKAVVNNGTYLGYHLMPEIGYETHREISDSLTRKKFNLPPQPEVRSVYDKEARMDLFGEQQLTFEAVLGTSEEQTAVTAGSLQSSWMENGRRYSHYKTDAPIRHNYEIFSAVYEVHKAKCKDVEINIYHHPDHTKNLERMAKGMVASLDYFSKNFSPYPHRQMNLVEYPASGVGLNGNPVTMSYSEGFSFFNVEKEVRNIDFPFAVIAHEVAHQWWGGELRLSLC